MHRLKTKLRVIGFAFYTILVGCSVYVAVDTFIIPHEITSLEKNESIENQSQEAEEVNEESNSTNSEVVITSTSYQDENISIEIITSRTEGTTYYVADIMLSSADYLKTALANDTYGRNIKETTSSIASEHQAIFAINGDYYGFRDYGYVIRNGVLYRDIPNEGNEALVIDENGGFSIVNESEVSAQELLDQGA